MTVQIAIRPDAAKPRRRSNEERSSEMRTALIEAVIQSLCELGYSKTTTFEICKRAGATSGAVQHHFGSKDELIIATLNRLTVEIVGRLEKLSELKGDLETRCGIVIRDLWETFYARKRYMAVWEVAIGSRGDHALHARVVEQRSDTLRACEVAWRKIFEISPQDGRQKMDAMHVVLSFLRGLGLYTEKKEDAIFIEAQLTIMTSALAGILKGKRNGGAAFIAKQRRKRNA